MRRTRSGSSTVPYNDPSRTGFLAQALDGLVRTRPVQRRQARHLLRPGRARSFMASSPRRSAQHVQALVRGDLDHPAQHIGGQAILPGLARLADQRLSRDPAGIVVQVVRRLREPVAHPGFPSGAR